MAKVIPGILTDSDKEYSGWLKKAEHVSDLIQIDIIDGKFAKNKTVGIETIKRYPASVNLEVQLMVVSPVEFVEEVAGIEYVFRVIILLEFLSVFL